MIIGGLDLGTSGCKFTVYQDLHKIAETSQPYPTIHYGRCHSIDANVVWEAVSSVIQRAANSIEGNDLIKAICVSSFGEAATPVDINGNVLAQARLFWDESGYEENERLVERLGKNSIYKATGLLPNRKYTINKIAWYRHYQPEIYEKAHKFLLFEDFIIYRLTGEYAISYSLAGRTMAFDLRKHTWAREIFEAAGVDVDKMSCPFPSGTIVGQVLPSISRTLHLDPSCVLVSGGHDQMCVTLGAGILQPGAAVNGSGTVEALSSVLCDPNFITAMRSSGYPRCIHADGTHCFTYGASSTGSVLLEWFLRTFGIRYMPAYKNAKNIYNALEEKIGSQPSNLLFLPYFEGAGLPLDDYNACGVFMGMKLSTSPQEMYHALMESITYDMCLNMLEQEKMGLQISHIVATGGGSVSPRWMQMKADVTGKPIHKLATRQAGTQGCMLLAAKAMGYFASLEEAIREIVHIEHIYTPIPSNHTVYRERLEQFVRLYQASRNIAFP